MCCGTGHASPRITTSSGAPRPAGTHVKRPAGVALRCRDRTILSTVQFRRRVSQLQQRPRDTEGTASTVKSDLAVGVEELNLLVWVTPGLCHSADKAHPARTLYRELPGLPLQQRAPSRIRTYSLLIRSQVLYPLSYRGTTHCHTEPFLGAIHCSHLLLQAACVGCTGLEPVFSTLRGWRDSHYSNTPSATSIAFPACLHPSHTAPTSAT